MQPIECKAAVAWEAEKPLDVTTVIVGPPQKGEVRVKVSVAEVLGQSVLLLGSTQHQRDTLLSEVCRLRFLAESWSSDPQEPMKAPQQMNFCCRLMLQRFVTQTPTLWTATVISLPVFLRLAVPCIFLQASACLCGTSSAEL